MTIEELFGTGKDLTSLQMSLRAIVVFIIALVLIRISGRRSFGIRTPLDNIIVILLGALLSRAVAGVSPFVPTIAGSFTIVLFHRVIGWLMNHNKYLERILDGKKILLFENGRFIKSNMERMMVSEEDVLQGVRKSALTDNLHNIDRVYIERTGEISALKK